MDTTAQDMKNGRNITDWKMRLKKRRPISFSTSAMPTAAMVSVMMNSEFRKSVFLTSRHTTGEPNSNSKFLNPIHGLRKPGLRPEVLEGDADPEHWDVIDDEDQEHAGKRQGHQQPVFPHVAKKLRNAGCFALDSGGPVPRSRP